ncbi:MAG: sigma 54-interacting transcriptional regulator [Clostridium argentinense]|uniref:Sigma 54-interacting transcriptional regulator n=1 Tax=Clostridium faecium TaxID=2762223 RepID=A0ABR8YSP3_9CLOT|nr:MULTISPECIES: sigma 54-interacting transcriptional regulator [Clostridium]MBD8047278.1 sigma 54-interacting transcriptional regulator [Clostridium faecium]MBS5824556.1 sigma 54-interacting transcriptional regulator [Clostridium argentinense]MDU1349143.1 sigma 54-interacting transcriptional regulator [Clostridium argentinense]
MKIDEKILNSIFNSIEESIVIVDLDGKIIMMSNEYKKFLECDSPEGKHVTEVIPNTKLHIVAETGEKEVGEIQEVNGHKMISMRAPLINEGKIIGAIGKVMFKDLSNFKILSSKISNLEKELEYYKNEFNEEKKAKYTFNNLVGKSEKFINAINLAKKVAKGDSNVLITGESGTGKELVAQAIHNGSKRCFKPFIKVNCAAIPSELFESEMFGYEEGAFTGARKSGKKGLFEYANGGTILLDEIGDMPLSMQVKLLRVLQERELVRVGGSEVKKINVRVIASTNKSLLELIEKGKFREDLYYRLNVMHIILPPLRERPEDIEPLCERLSINLCSRYGIYSEGVSKEALEYLKAYDWPGNVRQLENVLERAINLLDTELLIFPKHLPEKILKCKSKHYTLNEGETLKDLVEEIEKDIIIKALKKTDGNKNKAASMLGLSRTGLYKKLKRYNLESL